jgi:hypothetical protein
MTHPSYCCPKCGEQIGYIGRFFQFLRVPYFPNQGVLAKSKRSISMNDFEVVAER